MRRIALKKVVGQFDEAVDGAQQVISGHVLVRLKPKKQRFLPDRALAIMTESSLLPRELNQRRQLAPYYSAIGLPSIGPELMIRRLLVGYCCGIRSERRLCEEVHLNLAYRWFCRLGLTDAVPDHSTFSKDRHGRFRDSDLLRQLFEATVRRCMTEGIVGGQGFAVDASMIRADAHHQKGVANREELDPEDTTRAVTEYLAVLDDAAFGAATEVVPKFISPTDPAARWTAAAGGPACYAYGDNYLIDLEHAVIVDVQATTAVRQAVAAGMKLVLPQSPCCPACTASVNQGETWIHVHGAQFRVLDLALLRPAFA